MQTFFVVENYESNSLSGGVKYKAQGRVWKNLRYWTKMSPIVCRETRRDRIAV